MDPASLALGIASLYTTCRDCYDFFTTPEGVFNTLSALADTLSNQEKLIKRYGIQLRPTQDSPDELQSANIITLVIHNANIEDVTPVVNEVKKRLSVLNKCKWAMEDRSDFQKLITDLKSHSESLYRLCPENAFESMNIYLTMECLARQESPESLKSTSRLAIEQAAENGTSSIQVGYQLLASAATLKASINENKDGERMSGATLAGVNEVQGVMQYLGKGMALFEGQVVYVEMRDYRGAPLDLTLEQKKRMKRLQDRDRILASSGDNRDWHYLPRNETNSFYGNSNNEPDHDDEPIELIRPADPSLRALIVNLFKTFEGASLRDSVFGLDIAGMIDHTEGEYKGHCSILYRLPGTIGIPNRERPAENLKLRAPVTLQSLLRNKYTKGMRSMLGARFGLIRRLVRVVCMLQSSGWLHKNIRPESVMFFPEHVSALLEDRYETDIEIDVSNPILMGYIFSRPDDITQKPSTSTQQTGGHNGVYPGDKQRRPLVPAITQDFSCWEDPRTFDPSYAQQNRGM